MIEKKVEKEVEKGVRVLLEDNLEEEVRVLIRVLKKESSDPSLGPDPEDGLEDLEIEKEVKVMKQGKLGIIPKMILKTTALEMVIIIITRVTKVECHILKEID